MGVTDITAIANDAVADLVGIVTGVIPIVVPVLVGFWGLRFVLKKLNLGGRASV